jgi:hypothetical protein
MKDYIAMIMTLWALFIIPNAIVIWQDRKVK